MVNSNFDRAYSKSDLKGRYIGGRISRLLGHSGYTSQSALAKEIQIREDTLSRIIGGNRAPTLEQLKKIALALNTSMEYIMTGNTPTDWPCEDAKISFPERLTELKNLYQFSTIESMSVRITVETGAAFGRITLSRLVNGNRQPNLEHIYLLSRFFRCSMDYLLPF